MTQKAGRQSASTGTLFVVGTPIGNLADLSPRAVQTLRDVTRIAAEDTRRTRALLTHFGIGKKPLTSLEAHASERRIDELVARLVGGDSVAFVTDAGMPAISDPGARLVRVAAQHGIAVRAVPGPSAVTTAVALSGLVEGPFRFLGFVSRRGGARDTALSSVADASEPSVLFEAPGRVQALLDDLAALCPDRPAALCRELTKLHEETIYGTLAELAARGEPFRGEVTLVVGAGSRLPRAAVGEAELDARIVERLAQGQTPRTVADELARACQLPRRAVYARVHALKRDT